MANRQFEGKVAIVTGGASGIGYACSTTLAQGGVKFVVADISDELGNRVERAESDDDSVRPRRDLDSQLTHAASAPSTRSVASLTDSPSVSTM